jgi:ABC-type transport system involved in multi-copper enzyme maturation permease subunit
MKYLAILKDSLYEALDTKVIYFTLGLSCLVILGVASISFKPQPAEQGLRSILGRFAGAQTGFGKPLPILRYEIEDFQQLNDSAPWLGKYRFTLIAKELPTKDAKGDEKPLHGAFRAMVWLSTLQVDEENLSSDDKEARKRLVALREQAQTLPPDQLEKFLEGKLRDEINRIAPSQMERFINQQLSAYGTLETTGIQLKSDELGSTRFEVETQANPETFRSWPHSVTYGFGAIPTQSETPIGHRLFDVQDTLIGSIGAGITMLLSAIITAFFIPNMLRKGTVDLLLAKPIHRSVLLIYKFIGGLAFMFVNTLFVVVGVWFVLGLRSGIWSPGFLASIFVLTYQFAIFYAVSTLFGVLTRSPIVAILASCFAWVVLWAAGTFYMFAEATREFELMPSWAYTIADTTHAVLPRYKDLDALNTQLIGRDLLGPNSPERKVMDKLFNSISWGVTLGFTTGYIALFVGLACWRFATKDY